ncbi:alpha/beta fold hydrolase [Candidatus Puniceispirillum marinum]|uniref:Hydrolase, alpha/beta fold family n=1 Tax=Puniceispirillum marinum (strain IMCC1322) TaxID=488538 RepID=D5BNJ7_PUNMI|nr:alpha/beta hydrolase [Candidatus Puniceispirillum marinum]ADE38264.1 hydrolase, alpha/beta fold family [Candidatus Puniceispirillum marinum IMCC1322]
MYRHASEAGLVLPSGTDINQPYDGHNLRGHLAEIADQSTMQGKVRGHVLLCPGFTEFCEKYSDVIKAFNDRGYNVLAIDWPGQGMSGHLGRHRMAVHCDSFDQHIGAMDRLITAVGWQDRPVILFGHSMGGHLALRLCQHLRAQVQAAIILSPMIVPPVMPVWMVRLITQTLVAAGFGRFYLPFKKPPTLDYIRQFRPHNLLSRDKAGYESQFVWFDDNPELRRSQPTAGWVRAAYESCARTTLNKDWMAAVDCPVLGFEAGDERVVHKKSSDRMLACLPHLTRYEYDGARHELLNETPDVVADIWTRIDAFLGGRGQSRLK